MHRWYANDRDTWVEPRTGAIVNGRESPRIYDAQHSGDPGVTVMNATMALTDDSVESQLRETRKGIAQLTLGFRTAPLALLLTAGISAVAAAYLLRRVRRLSKRPVLIGHDSR